MLQRIYIDNYKCCVNFEVKFDAVNLLLGDNGVGKSTIFETLRKVQSLVGEGREISDLFPTDTLTRWQTNDHQHFEIEIDGNGGEYRYELVVEHNRLKRLSQIHTERLWFDNQLLIDFSGGNAHESQSERETNILGVQGRNFVSWYRFVSQNQGKAFEITNALQKVIDGFKYFEFEQAGENQRILRVHIANQMYRFDELSDGQRALIVLYTLTHFAQGQDYTLCIDEPENFISLPEIQPWLSQLYDAAGDGELQALLISHHPELINYLAGSAGIWFARSGDTPVRVSSLPSASGLSMSELVARGWIYEPA